MIDDDGCPTLGRVRQAAGPMLLAPGGPLAFPDPRQADEEGLVAIGGDLSPSRLLHAYERGIFPWYNEGLPPLWWSPDPRALIDCANLHVSRSLRRTLRRVADGSSGLRVSRDEAFREVILCCAGERDGGTWILPEVIEAYHRLHELGHAHSFEVWEGERLVGGLYGVKRGGLFAGESMFHRKTDASKVALVLAARTLAAAGVSVFDVQFETEHLRTFGVSSVPRSEYLARVQQAVQERAPLAGVEPRLLE